MTENTRRFEAIERDVSDLQDVPKENGWRLDKHIPIALLGAVILQTLAVGAWVGTIHQRVNSIETSANDAKGRADRVETALGEIKGDVREIKTTINILLPKKNGK